VLQARFGLSQAPQTRLDRQRRGRSQRANHAALAFAFPAGDLQPDSRGDVALKATVNRDGQPTSQERRIEVMAGNNVVVDFSQPAGSTVVSR
jgi:hypothetical protein